MGFSRQEIWSGSPFSSTGVPPNSGIESTSLASNCLLHCRRIYHLSHHDRWHTFRKMPSWKRNYETNSRTPLVACWLKLCASNAGGTGSIPGQGTKIPHALQCGQKTENKQRNKCHGRNHLDQNRGCLHLPEPSHSSCPPSWSPGSAPWGTAMLMAATIISPLALSFLHLIWLPVCCELVLSVEHIP